MPHLRFAALVLAVAFAAPAFAEGTRPYAPAHVTYDRSAENDPALKTLIERLRAAVTAYDLDALAKDLSPDLAIADCSADPLKACPAPAAPPKPSAKPTAPKRAAAPPRPLERLLQGLCCKDIPRQHITKQMREQTALGIIGAALEEETLGSNPDLPGAACLPAFPLFDRVVAIKTVEAADIEPANLRVTAQPLELRARPDAAASVSATLPKGALAALVTELPESLPDGWTALALPQGGLGFTREGGLNDLAPAGICFAKDGEGAWKIALVALRRS